MVAADDALVPPWLDRVVDDIADRQRAGAGIRAVSRRAGEFPSRAAMRLAGVAMVPEARDILDAAITAHWQGRTMLSYADRERHAVPADAEVAIGAGYHAAVYAAARVRAGFPPPYVIDRAAAARIGGAFRMSAAPSFWLNSENRPGRPGLPLDGGALNFIPGAILQPSMTGAGEFTDNAQMAFAIRVALAQYALVVPELTVTGIVAGDRPRLQCEAGDGEFTSPVECARGIDARGMGDENGLSPAGGQRPADGERVLTFGQLMALMDGDFPFRGMDRVALVGSGDSARCAAEALMGIGPQAAMRSAMLDGYPRIDWYAPGLPADALAWRMTQRGRYQRLSSYLPTVITDEFEYYDSGSEGDEVNTVRYRSDRYHDITVIAERGAVTRAGDEVYVNGRAYTHAVLCTGMTLPPLAGGEGQVLTTGSRFRPGPGVALARRLMPRVYAVGPAAGLDFDPRDNEAGVTVNPASKVAMFRLAGKTAQLAGQLPEADKEPGA